MKKMLWPALMLGVGLFMPSTAQAGFVVQGMAGQTVNTASVGAPSNSATYTAGVYNNNTGVGYWDGKSSDFGGNSNANIGNFLTKTGSFAGNSNSPNIAAANLRSYQNANGSGVSFAQGGLSYGAGAVASSFKILVEVAGLSAQNQLWYRQGNILTRIFSGANGAGQSASVTISGQFTLYLIRGLGASPGSYDLGSNNVLAANGIDWASSAGQTRNTQNGQNNAAIAQDKQNFASFFEAGKENKLYTGIEDLLPPQNSDNDFNDLVVSFALEAVPAPPALILAALGVPAFGLFRRFTRKAPVAVA